MVKQIPPKADKEVAAALDEIDEQLKAEQQAYITSALTELSKIEGEIAELGARIPALEDRVERTTIRSPVDGVINRINYVTEDAYALTQAMCCWSWFRRDQN